MSNDLAASSDTPMHRLSVEEMTDEQLQDMIVNKRDRRMTAYNAFEEAVRMEKETRNQKLLIDLKRQGELLQKKLSTIDKALEASEKYVVKIIAIRNELGLEQHLRGDDNGSETTRDTDAPSAQGRSGSDNLSVCSGGGAAGSEPDVEGDGGCDQPDVGHHADNDGSGGADEEPSSTASWETAGR